MANRAERHPENVEGAWFVDTTCIDCDAARQCAPTIFGVAEDGKAVVIRQPETAEEVAGATRALLACPTGSIGAEGVELDSSVLPEELEDGVFYCGFNSRDSFGANSFFVAREGGNLLVDSPRWTPHLVRDFEERGGIDHVLLTHRDDVADAERYAEHFSARVWIHEQERDAAPFASDVIAGEDPVDVGPALTAIPVPGHTRGSVAFLLEERFLFTGDSLHWSRIEQDLGAFPGACWYSWEAQTRSLERLAGYRFEWVLAGHGDRQKRPADEMRSRLLALTARMKNDEVTGEW